MDPFKPPFPSNRERYFAIPPNPHHIHSRSPLLRLLHQPRISPPPSPHRPSRYPYNTGLHRDPRKPLPSPIPGRPHDLAASDHLVPLPFPDGRRYLPNDAVASPVFLWNEVQGQVRRRSPPPIGREKHPPRSPDTLGHHHQGLPLPLSEAAESGHIIRKRFDPLTERFEFVHDDRCCADDLWDLREHHHHEEDRRVRRRIDPRFEPFMVNSIPSSSSTAVDPDRRPVEWATWSKSHYNAIENLERNAVERPEKTIYSFDGPVPPDHSRDRYLTAGLKPPDHGPVKKVLRIRHPVEGPRRSDPNSVERFPRSGHFLDGFNTSKPPDYATLDRDGRIRCPFDSPKPPEHSSIKRDTRIRRSFDGRKPLDHASVEGAQWGCDSLDASKLLQQHVEREPMDDDHFRIHQPNSWEKAKGPIRHDNDSMRFVPGTRPPLHARLSHGKKMVVHENLQKPSALLRIQPASKLIRKRKDEPLVSSANVDSLSNADPKSKAVELLPQHVLEKDSSLEIDGHARVIDGKKMMGHEKLQKPSALLRISKPIRKRRDEPMVSSSNFGGMNNANLEVQVIEQMPKHMPEKDSSLELDVSFKSNALVAKPILFAPAKLDALSNKMVLDKKRKKKIIKRFVSRPIEKVTQKSNPGLTSDPPPKEMVRHSGVKEESRSSPRMDGNGSADALCGSPCEDIKQIGARNGKVCNAGSSDHAALGSCPSEAVLLDDSSVEGSPMVATTSEDQKRDRFHEENDMKIFCPNRDFTSCDKELVVLDSQSTSLSGGDLQEVIPASTVNDGHGHCPEASVAESEREGKDKMEASILEEHGTISSINCKDAEEVISQVEDEGDIVSLAVKTSDFDHRSPADAADGEGADRMVQGLHQSDSILSEEQVLPVTTVNANEDEILHSPDQLSMINSPESLPVIPDADIPITEQSLPLSLDGTHALDSKNNLVERSDGEDNHGLKSQDSEVSACEAGGQLMDENDHVIHVKAPVLAIQETKKPMADTKSTANELSGKSTHHISGIPRSFRHSAAFASGPMKNSSARIIKPRTWHRTDVSSTSPSPVRESGLSQASSRKQSPKRAGNVQIMSYIRKGNSLVRNFAPGAAFPQASQGLSTNLSLANTMSGDKMITRVDTERKVKNTISSKTGANTYIDRPNTPPLLHATLVPNCSVNHPNVSSYSTTVEPPAVSEAFLCEPSGPVKPIEAEDAPYSVKASEKQSVDVIALQSETRSALGLGKSKSPKTKTKKMIYVKRKSNQLVAAPRPEIMHALPCSTTSDTYYKRKKNQLVRNNVSLESQLKQAAAAPDDNSNSEGQRAIKISSFKYGKGLSKRRFNRVVQGASKTSKLSLVWNLGGMQPHNKDMTSLKRWNVLPYLVPWKRTTYRRSIINDNTVSKNSSSLIRKLQMSRKRDMLYTRSKNGFSLRKSRVLSIGGAGLKWSKSIEARSKKANEEATLAVAAVEREKREQMGGVIAGINAKGRSCAYRKSFRGERIFRIGCFRYKMDVSKRTLLRIPDEKSSCSTDVSSGRESKISFIPKRLLIGNEEYIRIGNGNQLIRDPKRLTRMLASEKIRWSLHTARLRLARKKQFCQFFMRFGKCRKDDGKCPYIHDPDKVAVCTKFLKGLCSDAKCRLTHKVIPERMQDCSYFLQGLCTNESCPYRHINVNPDSSVCDGFLRGYCADGNECCKKHSYVCPMFKANGICPQGSACKLHHQKYGNKCKKRKRKKQKNGRGRYFGSSVMSICLPEKIASEECSMEEGGDIFFMDGRYANFVSLDASDEESKETDTPTGTNPMSCGGDSSDLQEDDLDMLIKPVRLMNESAS